MIRVLRLVLGYVCIGIGFIGIFMPLLPTTPFFLLALLCFSASPTVREKMLRIPIIREYTICYIEKRAISKIEIMNALIGMWVVLALSFYGIYRSSISNYWILIPFSIGILVSIHLIYLYNSRKGLYNEKNNEKS